MTNRVRYSLISVTLAALTLAVILIFTRGDTQEHIRAAAQERTATDPSAEKMRSSQANRPNVTKSASVQGATLKNMNIGTNATLSRSEMMRISVESHNVPIVFFGKVIDQNNTPLPGVMIRMYVRNWQFVEGQDGVGVYPKREAVSAVDGTFAFGGEQGDYLQIEGLKKEGYESEPTAVMGFPYEASDPGPSDKNNPVLFKMWKSDIRAQLVKNNTRFYPVPDGRAYTIDLLTGLIKESATEEGDLRILIHRSENAVFGKHYDWTFEIVPINGGMFAETDPQSPMLEAPEGGYTDNYRLAMSATDDRWSDATGRKRFYLKSRGGQNYSRIEIEAYAYSQANQQGRVLITYAVNPKGQRLLR